MQFNKILIANRGEIAVRIISAAKDLGYRTVAVFSEADRNSVHAKMADEAVYIGPANASDSYLCLEKIIEAAKLSKADAIHPGYGFLSENAQFAINCMAEGIKFIGPDAKVIELMGRKRQAKVAMHKAGIPCIPGYQGGEQEEQYLLECARKIGFPIMIKASAGGGGRGMRLVDDELSFKDAVKSARSESLNAFGSKELILEKALFNARHIEFQILADEHGNVIHLGERDCSVQRRHQKVIEEAPSMALSKELREIMGNVAIKVAQACNYTGAGTVEFLLDESGDFYFLEMNTRLQVEHPVTELVTGLDLVGLQLRIASGESLPIEQQQVKLKGHAMEVRLYAEDPANNFTPQTGTILLWQPALRDGFSDQNKNGVRLDSGIEEGQEISAYYDPMLAKLITFGENREQARRRLIRLVEDSHLLGVRDNRAFLTQLLSHKTFIQGDANINFVAERFSGNSSMLEQRVNTEELALAALIMTVGCGINRNSNEQSVFYSSNLGERLLILSYGNQRIKLSVSHQTERRQDDAQVVDNTNIDNGHLVCAYDESWSESIENISIDSHRVKYLHGGVIKTRGFTFDKSPSKASLWLTSPNGNLQFFDRTTHATKTQTSGSDQVVASMDGTVVHVLVSEGDTIQSGDVVAVIEAMKMEHLLKASIDGCVEKIMVAAGEQVKARQLIVQLLCDETFSENTVVD